TEEACARVEAWTAASPAVIVEPTPDHPAIMRRLLGQVGAGGNLVNDAHLAALAIEHRCTVVSYDNDFSRFDGVIWERPGV
ncbi:MAG: PIN domain-containing protein, partial [Actinobacteria bacterium]|nr:PIN domain-containing protein [Actinomycetota bacterium]